MYKKLLTCICNSTEHQIVVYINKDDGNAFCHIHLSDNEGFFKRFYRGLKYIG